MLRAAIYARFSSENQNDRSIEDQIELCRDLCRREKMQVVATFDDRALSGTSVINRSGFQKMMRAAEARRFDVIVAEDMDRLFRDQADYHNARKQLDHFGVAIHTASGKVTKLDGALRALMGEMYIDNLVLHVRRGMDGVIRQGRHAGGKAYGYKPTPGRPGVLQIVPEQADVVRRIFREYVGGKAPRDIAAGLNADNIAPPRGARWNASTINGDRKRGGGILINEVYIGRIIWNKNRMVKDPNTGKRLSRQNPGSEWRIADAPQLRIIADETWAAAQARKQRNYTPNSSRRPRTARLLSGLLKCAACGGGMGSLGVQRGEPRIQCSTHRESRTCSNTRMLSRDAIEFAVLEGLHEALKDPGYLKAYLTEYNAERAHLAHGATRDRSKLERRSGEVAREIERLVDAIVSGAVRAETVAARLKALETERDEIGMQLASINVGKKGVSIHPATVKNYLTDLTLMREALQDENAAARQELFEPIRRLIHSVVVDAQPNERGFKLEIKGRLLELIGAAPIAKRKVAGGSVVAGEGFEPPTPGL